MRVLGFTRAAQLVAGRRVRTAVFEARSDLPVAAACLVANGVRETLARLFGQTVCLRLLEPRLPSASAWAVLARDARCFRVRGPLADAAFVIRPDDALALASAAFGERPGPARDLSPIESRVLDRAVSALHATLAPVCGAVEPAALEPLGGLETYATYFELLVDSPAAARIGVAISREPTPAGGGRLRAADLSGVELELNVEFAGGFLALPELLGLRPGMDVPMTTKMGAPGLVTLAGTVVARGECGVVDGRYALIVREIAEGT
ncbi:MAG: FliM/FliN family flagellar motor C-terminal domain-containing protein [Candidatus Eremiobacteraeota bacterium]|nr:FliM/FliN family flagellar motor C-terminal domain-containing protein [Candidatus Eremiobacteraeota bacterium]